MDQVYFMISQYMHSMVGVIHPNIIVKEKVTIFRIIRNWGYMIVVLASSLSLIMLLQMYHMAITTPHKIWVLTDRVLK